ncbi:hypothetical protein [Paenibacillus sp. NPDC057967]|uniref:hypothetical protein n=1 Tax=Paenibacillus sp. NPDC057967 TaxID=3346293 RepID=UPI0036D95446
MILLKPANYLILFATICCLFAACSHTKANLSEPALSEKKLHQFYPGELENADEIRIRSGSTGELRTYTDKHQIQQWLDSVRDITFQASPHREDGVGYLYLLYILERGEEKLAFFTTSIDEHYYTDSKELHSRMEELFVQPAANSGL